MKAAASIHKDLNLDRYLKERKDCGSASMSLEELRRSRVDVGKSHGNDN